MLYLKREIPHEYFYFTNTSSLCEFWPNDQIIVNNDCDFFSLYFGFSSIDQTKQTF